jgi:hypothetical protein
MLTFSDFRPSAGVDGVTCNHFTLGSKTTQLGGTCETGSGNGGLQDHSFPSGHSKNLFDDVYAHRKLNISLSTEVTVV